MRLYRKLSSSSLSYTNHAAETTGQDFLQSVW